MRGAGQAVRGLAGILAVLALLAPRAALAQQGFEQRRDAVLAAQIARPFPSPACRNDQRPDNACIWGQVTLAMAMLATEPARRAEANRLLAEAARAVPARPGWQRLADPARAAASARVDPAFDFPFLTATLFYRALGAFGTLRAGTAPLLEPATEAAIRALFRDWVLTGCRIEDAAPAMVWRPWGTENHDIQRVHACWAGADLLRRDPAAPPYADGSTAQRQYAAWSDYLRRFIRARGSAGVSVEFFSPTYSKYFLGPLYNIMDFAEDRSLAQLAQNLVSLWWALWAEEQLGGVHGGSKVRVYAEAMPNDTPMDGPAWAYLGLGPRMPGAGHPAYFPMLLSPYRLPAVIADLARDARGRGSYEAWTREPGFVAGPIAAERIPVAPDPVLTRYAYATPDFVMGAMLAPRLPLQQWASISAQNRWNGVILAGPPDARIYAAPAPTGGRSTYNAVIAAQSRGTQIVQRIAPPLSRGTGDMAIWVGPSLRRAERGDWIFAAGSAYVAARPAFGGYSAADPRYALNDQRAPVILFAARTEEFASFDAFQSAVLAAPLAVSREAVEFRAPGAGTLRFFLEGIRPAELDGRPIAMPAGWTLLSPFIHQRTGEPVVDIAKGSERLTLRFDIGE